MKIIVTPIIYKYHEHQQIVLEIITILKTKRNNRSRKYEAGYKKTNYLFFIRRNESTKLDLAGYYTDPINNGHF